MKLKSFKYAYLGFTISFFTNLSVLDWQLYVIIVPAIIMDAISSKNENE